MHCSGSSRGCSGGARPVIVRIRLPACVSHADVGRVAEVVPLPSWSRNRTCLRMQSAMSHSAEIDTDEC